MPRTKKKSTKRVKGGVGVKYGEKPDDYSPGTLADIQRGLVGSPLAAPPIHYAPTRAESRASSNLLSLEADSDSDDDENVSPKNKGFTESVLKRHAPNSEPKFAPVPKPASRAISYAAETKPKMTITLTPIGRKPTVLLPGDEFLGNDGRTHTNASGFIALWVLSKKMGTPIGSRAGSDVTEFKKMLLNEAIKTYPAQKSKYLNPNYHLIPLDDNLITIFTNLTKCSVDVLGVPNDKHFFIDADAPPMVLLSLVPGDYSIVIEERETPTESITAIKRMIRAIADDVSEYSSPADAPAPTLPQRAAKKDTPIAVGEKRVITLKEPTEYKRDDTPYNYNIIKRNRVASSTRL